MDVEKNIQRRWLWPAARNYKWFAKEKSQLLVIGLIYLFNCWTSFGEKWETNTNIHTCCVKNIFREFSYEIVTNSERICHAGELHCGHSPIKLRSLRMKQWLPIHTRNNIITVWRGWLVGHHQAFCSDMHLS